jgi:hypothetical protein
MLEALQFYIPWVVTLYPAGKFLSNVEMTKQLLTTAHLHRGIQQISMILGP